MPVRVACPSCAARFRVPDDRAGRSIYCPKCRSAILVPNHPTSETFSPAPISGAGSSTRKGPANSSASPPAAVPVVSPFPRRISRALAIECPVCRTGTNIAEPADDGRSRCPKCNALVSLARPEASWGKLFCRACEASVLTTSHPPQGNICCPFCGESAVDPKKELLKLREDVERASARCVGCGKRLNVRLTCGKCKMVFCSEMCINRHSHLTGHLRRRKGCGAAAALVLALAGTGLACLLSQWR